MKLLVAVDGSNASDNALAYASDVADAMNGSITVLHAVDPDVYDEGGAEPISTLSDAEQRLVIESLEDAEDRGWALIDDAAEFAAEHGHDVERVLLHGTPVAEIAEYAEEHEFDAIYVGHRGLSERTERLLGSVAKGLVARATVPVTVVR
jgi:nucleotide-binding universal stress UspA family protein